MLVPEGQPKPVLRILSQSDFQIFLSIIRWGKCVWVINCGQIGIKLLCDYGSYKLNFEMWCTLSAFGVSSEHLNYTKHPMIRAVYQFHVYYHVRRVLKRLQVPLPHETGFNIAGNPYTRSEFLKICEDYRVPNDPMR